MTVEQRTTSRGRLALPTAVLALALGLAAVPGLAAQSSANGVDVKIRSLSQQRILTKGAIRVKATVPAGETGALTIRGRLLDPGSKRRFKITRRVTRELDSAGVQRFSLPLTNGGRTLLTNCAGPKTLVVKAAFRPSMDDAVSAKGKDRGQVRIDSPACGGPGSGGGGDNPGGPGPDPDPDPDPDPNTIPDPQPYTGPPIDTANSARCDFLDTAVCLQPFPNDYFTVIDESTDTDRRLNLNLQSMPANRAGKPIDPAEQNRNDGFSPGSMLITRVPGLQSLEAFENTGAVPISDLAAYDDPNQPVVVINAETGERHPIWSEIDSNPIDTAACDATPPLDEEGKTRLCEPDKVNLIIRPAVNFEEGARYVVALRNMKNAADETIEPANAFKVYRDNLTTEQPAVEDRRDDMEELFAILGDSGIQRSSLYLTWDFTVASERNLTERALAIRDDAFAKLGDTNLGDLTVQGTSPQFSAQAPQDDNGFRIVSGNFTVPCYLNAPGCPPGSRFTYAPGSTVPLTAGALANTASAPFTCVIPDSATAANPARVSLYGHGLLGAGTEVDGGNIHAMATEHNMVFCATDWAGFSTLDLPTVLANLQDLSHFSALVDRMQQGFVNFMYLGRLMLHDMGFANNAGFQDGGEPIIDTGRLFYDGNSQGGIMSGALTALAPDYERAVFGVPGMNYSTLLTRSVDFEPYAEGQFEDEVEGVLCDGAQDLPDQFGDFRDQLQDLCEDGIPADTELGLYDNYPNQLERPLIFALMQILWDRGEANGYAHHITDDPLDDATDAGTPSHDVLLHPAFGDHQVANVTAEVEARTIGASVYEPALDPTDTDPQSVDPGPNMRHWEADPFMGIPSIGSFPFGGSALVYWDGGPLGFDGRDGDTDPDDGTATPPDENIPPRPPMFGADPHSYPRSDPKARAQKAAFLAMGGQLRNPCTSANNFFNPPLPIQLDAGTPLPCYANGWTGPTP